MEFLLNEADLSVNSANSGNKRWQFGALLVMIKKFFVTKFSENI